MHSTQRLLARSPIEIDFHIHRAAVAALVLALPAPAAAGDDEEDGSDVVVVTGSRTEKRLGDTPVATEVITRADIEASGAENVGDLLEQHPGLQVDRSFRGTSVRMRGLDPEHVLVLVDGQRVVGRVDGAVDLSRFPVDEIEQIEIVKGPGSALYGSDAMGGVVNIVTRRGRSPFEAGAHGRYGSFGAADASLGVGARGEVWANRTTVGWHSSRGYDLEPSDVATTGSAFREYSFSDRADVWFSPDAWADLRASYMRRSTSGVDASDSGAVFDRANLAEEVQLAAGPRWMPDDRSKLQLDAWFTLYRDQYLLDQRKSDALDDYEDTRDRLAQASAQYDRVVGTHALTVGAEAAAEGMTSGRLDGGEGARQRLGAFAQDEWTLGPVVLVPGVRLDLDSWYGAHPSPKLSARWDPRDAVVVRASAGWGYRAPSFKELLLRFENPGAGYVVEGNPDLEPEVSRGVDATVEVDPTEWLGATVSLYRNDLDHLVTVGTIEEGDGDAPTRYGYVNVASAWTQGGEAVLALAIGELDVDLAYALTLSRDVQGERPLEGRAPHEGSFAVDWHRSAWRTHAVVRGSVTGPRPFFVDTNGDGAEDTVWSEPYASIDARLAWTAAPFLDVFAGVDNLLDAGDGDWLPMPPRLVYAGVDGRFDARPRAHDEPAPDREEP